MQQSVKEERWRYIGGSDIPIIMGLSPFKSRYDLLLEKAQISQSEFDGNEYTEYGDVMEAKIRDYVNRHVEGKPFIESKVIDGIYRYHADGFNGDTVLEIKTTSQVHKNVNDYMLYLVQLLTGMKLNNVKSGILAVYERPKDFSEELDPARLQLFEIDIDDYKQTIDEIHKAVELFEQDLDRIKADPFLTEQDLLPDTVKDLGNKIVAMEDQIALLKQMQEQYDALKADMFKAMTDNAISKWVTPNGFKFTLVQAGADKTVDTFDEKGFKKDHPDLHALYTKQTTKKGRAGYLLVTAPKETK